MSSYSRFKNKVILIILLLIIFVSTAFYSWVQISKSSLYEARDKLVIMKGTTKGFKDKDYTEMYNETKKFVENIPVWSKYSFEEGMFSKLFLFLSDFNYNQKKDFVTILLNFAEKNKYSSHRALAYVNIANLYKYKREFAKAEEYYTKALDAEKSIAGPFSFLYKDRTVKSSALVQRGIVRMLLKKFDSAQQDYEEAITKLPNNNLKFFTKIRLKGRIAESLLFQNKDDKARAIISEILNISKDKSLLKMEAKKLNEINKGFSSEAMNKDKDPEILAKSLSAVIIKVHERLVLTLNLPFEHRKVERVVRHYRSLKRELRDQYGADMVPAQNSEKEKITDKKEQ